MNDLGDEVLPIRESSFRGRPFGKAAWQRQVAPQLGLEHTFRPRGRPRKQPAPAAAKQ